MRYITIPMLMQHAQKSRGAVVNALKAAKVPMEKTPGVHGFRITEKDANRFLARQWPEVGILPVEQR